MVALLIVLLITVSAGLGGTIIDGGSVFSASDGEGAAEAIAVFAPDEEAGGHYIVRDVDGRVAIFADGEDTPICTLDVFVFTLPEKTAEMLKSGIECDDDGLRLLIEAFTS